LHYAIFSAAQIAYANDQASYRRLSRATTTARRAFREWDLYGDDPPEHGIDPTWMIDETRQGEVVSVLQRLSAHGVEWFSYREEYLRSVGVFKEAVLATLAAIAKQERIRLSERVHAGLSRAKAQGKVLGRPRAAVRPERVRRLRERGLSLPEIGCETGVSFMTVQRILTTQPVAK
jgi:hypothetical protein